MGRSGMYILENNNSYSIGFCEVYLESAGM